MRTSHVAWACAVLLSSLLGTVAQAERELSVGVTVGTLGVGPEFGWRFNENLGVRGNLGWLSVGHDIEVDDIDYNGDLDLLSVGGMLDWYPFGGGFRVSGGVRWNGNEVNLDATPAGPVTIGGTTYTPAEVGELEGTVEANAVVPVLTLGYAGKIGRRVTLGFELGVLYQGAAEVSNLQASGLLATDPNFLAAIGREADEIEDEIHDYQVWPILQVMLLYRF